MLELYIGNKNYSSWSMRPWLVLEHFQIPFKEHLVAFDGFKQEGAFKQTMRNISPTGKVPTLIQTESALPAEHATEHFAIWDSLAICEFLAEQYPHLHLWPKSLKVRAHARALCAEMHSGFQSLRQLCAMNIQADLTELGAKHWHEQESLRADVARIEAIWAMRPKQTSFIFGEFGIVDAFFAPVVMRFISYRLPVSVETQSYMQNILAVPAVQKWIAQAQQELV